MPPILNREAFEVGLANYHDRTFVNNILNCIDNGVNIGFCAHASLDVVLIGSLVTCFIVMYLTLFSLI